MTLKSVKTTKFCRDTKRCIKQHKNIQALLDVMTLLENGENLTDHKEYNDHKLTGNFKNVRECHLLGRFSDWLLLYEQKADAIIYIALGSHSEIYDK
jgi:mRNA interferase YafQ